MGFYFYANGKPNLKFLTFQTSILTLLMINSYNYSIHRITDNTMKPFFKSNGGGLTGWLSSDYVLYKHITPTSRAHSLKGKVLAIKNP